MAKVHTLHIVGVRVHVHIHVNVVFYNSIYFSKLIMAAKKIYSDFYLFF